MQHWTLIGIPHDLRITEFSQVLATHGYTYQVVDYATILQGEYSIPTNSIVRIDSPARNLDVVKTMMQRGERYVADYGLQPCSATTIKHSLMDKGEFIAPHQFFYGFREVLHSIDNTIKNTQSLGTHAIADIELVYDKVLCHQFCQSHDLPVPKAINPIASYEQLRAVMQERGIHRVFVKNRYGSGGSGIVALAINPRGNEVLASTTLIAQDKLLMNSLKVRRIHNETEISYLIKRLCAWGVQVEEWIPKATVERHSTDLRILVVNGKPTFVVLRKSLSPITNLHLLNERAPPETLIKQMSEEAWQAVLTTCERTAALFPHCLQIALDIAIDHSLKRHFILEINAFGDYLRNVTYQNFTPYQWQVQEFPAWLQRQHA